MRIDKTKILLIALALLLAAVLLVLVIVALGDLADRKAPQDGPTVATTQPQGGEDVTVQTPYGNMVFPGQWADYLKVEQTKDPDLTIRFIAKLSGDKTHDLFDVRFGEATEPAVGQVVSDEGVAVGIHVTVHPFEPDGSWATRDAEAVAEMLECVADVLKGLNMVPLGTPIPEVNGDEMTIGTPYCDLYFPSRWKEELQLTIEQTDGYDLIFSAVIGEHEAIRVFAVNFGGSENMGQVAHTLVTENQVHFNVRARIFALETEGWSSVDQATVVAMQEDMNHLLAKLLEA